VFNNVVVDGVVVVDFFAGMVVVLYKKKVNNITLTLHASTSAKTLATLIFFR